MGHVMSDSSKDKNMWKHEPEGRVLLYTISSSPKVSGLFTY